MAGEMPQTQKLLLFRPSPATPLTLILCIKKLRLKRHIENRVGIHVGLPEGQMGNSEGHMNLGAGRIVYQDLAKINLAVENDSPKSEKL